MPTPLKVYFWPESADSIPMSQSLIVIAVRTLPTTPRSQARKLIRMAITKVLAKQLACPQAEIQLLSQSGQALKLLHPTHNIGLSISHESALSLAAINMNGRVGVDLIDVKSIPNKNEIDTLANDYLGVKAAEYLSHLPPEQQKVAFAEVWTEFEARLKYQGKDLSEYDFSNVLQTSNLIARQLAMPEGYIGAVVFSESFNS